MAVVVLVEHVVQLSHDEVLAADRAVVRDGGAVRVEAAPMGVTPDERVDAPVADLGPDAGAPARLQERGAIVFHAGDAGARAQVVEADAASEQGPGDWRRWRRAWWRRLVFSSLPVGPPALCSGHCRHCRSRRVSKARPLTNEALR